MDRSLLHDALDKSLAFGCTYPHEGLQFASHLPMVLTALWHLGAPAEALDMALQRSHHQLVRLEPESAEAQSSRRFAFALRQDGLQAVLAETLPGLLLAPESGSFHGLACAALPGFDAAVSGAAAPADAALSLEALAEASLAIYLPSRDFTALHLVTTCHAWRLVEPLARLNAEESRIARRSLWRAWLAAWLSIGRPRPDWPAVHCGQADESSWQTALPTLSHSADEHWIKLAWTALEEWRHRRWPGYARALSRRTAS